MSNTPTKKDDLAFGTASEMTNLDILQQFFNTTLEKQDGYSVFDFMNPNKSIFVELKSRRIRHDTYDTALIGLNKIAFIEQMPEVEYWFAYCYTDGVWVIKYEKELFDTFEVRHDYVRGVRADANNRPDSVVFIPTKYLSKVNPNDELSCPPPIEIGVNKKVYDA